MTRQQLLDESSGYFLVKDQVSRNIHEGRQTQHRVPMKVQPSEDSLVLKQIISGPALAACRDKFCFGVPHAVPEVSDGKLFSCPWRVGQIIYLREAVFMDPIDCYDMYRADFEGIIPTVKWTPNILMPKAYARTFVKIKRVWPERVQDISEMDADDEGCDFSTDFPGDTFREKFTSLWESLYPGSWERNDWVWACEFEVVDYDMH